MSWFQRPAPVPEVEPAEASAALDAGDAVLVDVRDPHEWAAGHATGALHIPLPFLASRAGEIPTDRTVHLICAVGGRSSTATEMLTRAGYRAVNVRGGTSAWMRAGLPMSRD